MGPLHGNAAFYMARKAAFNPEDMQQANTLWIGKERETKYLLEDLVSMKKNWNALWKKISWEIEIREPWMMIKRVQFHWRVL